MQSAGMEQKDLIAMPVPEMLTKRMHHRESIEWAAPGDNSLLHAMLVVCGTIAAFLRGKSQKLSLPGHVSVTGSKRVHLPGWISMRWLKYRKDLNEAGGIWT